MRTKLSQVETNESFNNVQGEAYQKSKLFLDVLNAEITERELIGESTDDCDKTCPKSCPDCGGTGDPAKHKASMKEAAKPDFLDMDKDGDRKEPMKKAIKDKKKKTDESIVTEGEEDKAELVMASKDMVDKVTGWMEDTAEMQTESMLELADAIRDEHGSQVSEQFTATVKPALEAMYAAMETTRGALTQGVQMLTGEGDAPMMGADEPMPDMDMEPSMDMDMEAGATDLDSVDEFGAADAAAGGSDEAGRAKRESKKYNKQVIAEKSRKVASILSKKK
jgi:hypothetical protein